MQVNAAKRTLSTATMNAPTTEPPERASLHLLTAAILPENHLVIVRELKVIAIFRLGG